MEKYFLVENSDKKTLGCLIFRKDVRLFNEKLTFFLKNSIGTNCNFNPIESIDLSKNYIEIDINYYSKKLEQTVTEQIFLTSVECY